MQFQVTLHAKMTNPYSDTVNWEALFNQVWIMISLFLLFSIVACIQRWIAHFCTEGGLSEKKTHCEIDIAIFAPPNYEFWSSNLRSNSGFTDPQHSILSSTTLYSRSLPLIKLCPTLFMNSFYSSFNKTLFYPFHE